MMAMAAAAQQEGEEDGMAKIVAELVCICICTRAKSVLGDGPIGPTFPPFMSTLAALRSHIHT